MTVQPDRISVLIIDDGKNDRDLLRAFLEESADPRYQVSEASTAAQGIALAGDQSPDCILVDYQLPDADGLDILGRLDQSGILQHRAVIMLTGRGDERICAAAMKRGALDYARKSDLTSTGLSRIISHAVERSRLRRQVRDKQVAIESHSRELERAKCQLEATVEELHHVNSELEKANEVARFELTHDTLTGLPNRALLETQILEAIRYASRYEQHLAVLYFNMRRFSRIHEALGRVAADDILKTSASRLRSAVRDSDLVARVGADEFAVLLRRLKHPSDAGMVARKLLDVLTRSHEVGGGHIPASWNAGIALYPRDAREPEPLLLRAHTAMCESRQGERSGICFYDSEMNDLAQSELALEGSLREGLVRNELALVYQPLISIASSRLIGAEALLRWHHPTRGWLAPAQFLPLAERSDLIVEIGDWVMRRAFRQAQRWQAAGMPAIPIALNVSMRELRAPDLADRLVTHAFEAGISSELIRCELTEIALGENGAWATRQLERLRAAGIGIALDDFGMGHASLRTLERFPVDAVKIDRSFVTNADQNDRDAAITQAMLHLAHSLSLETVAVGVERNEGLRMLEDLGCENAQGFAVSRPLPPNRFLRWASRL